jgi:prepilin-type N-terminal cleavage/methylation domain-containing protein
MSHRSQSRGFTLLEVMLAVTILALISTAVYATWSAGLNGWKRSASVTETLQRERVVMEMLAELTQSLVYFTSKDSLYDIDGNRHPGTGDSISFVTASNLLLPVSEQVASGMRRITISLGRDARGRPFLGIANAPALEADETPEPVLRVLSADVCGFAVRYRDPQNGTWTDQWGGDTESVPAAIEYTVAFGANDGRTPPIVVTRAVDLPVAEFALRSRGETFSQQNTDHAVKRADIKLSGSSGTGVEVDEE